MCKVLCEGRGGVQGLWVCKEVLGGEHARGMGVCKRRVCGGHRGVQGVWVCKEAECAGGASVLGGLECARGWCARRGKRARAVEVSMEGVRVQGGVS